MLLRILSVALAVWLGGGAIAYGSAQARFALTPSIAWLAVALLAAILVRRRPIALLTLVLLLPWMPWRVPNAFLIWTGGAALWIGALVAAAIVLPWIARRARIDPARAPKAAFALAVVLFLAAAWRVSSRLPEGDEPHYLVITQSLLKDHDLQIENNHRRGDYHAYFSSELRPDYRRRGANEQIYSIHAPGLPAIVAPAFAAFGYPGVVIFLTLVAAAATALAWTTAFRVTGSVEAAWFGWAVVTLSEPFFVQSFMVYPDAPAGAIVMLAIATLVQGREASTRRLLLTGVALALLPWLHTRIAILAVSLGAVLAVRQFGVDMLKRIAALAAAPAMSAAAWFAFFYAVYGTPDPRAPYGSAEQLALASVPAGIIGLLFDQQFGLLANAPVYLFAALGFIPLFRQHRRVAYELVVALLPYVVVVAAFHMWWAGYTTPARFLVAALLPLAIPAAVWFDAIRRPTSRAVAVGTLALSALITITVVVVDRGALLLNFRDGASRLLVWLSRVVDLTTAVPSLFQSGPREGVYEATLWLLAIAAPLAVAHVVAVQRLERDGQRLTLGATGLVAAMIAAAVVWHSHGAAALTTDRGAVAWLRAYDGDASQFALSLSPFARVRRANVPAQLPIVDAAPGTNQPVAEVRGIPAATYAIDLAFARPAAGRVAIALDRALDPEWTFDLIETVDSWHRELVVPVASPVLLVDADPALRAALAHVTIRAVAVPGSRHRIADVGAVHAARYGRVLTFLLGGDAFMEPTGAWVQGASSAEFALVSDDRQPVEISVRTPPVANHVTFDGDGWHQEVRLRAGESKIITVPTDRIRVAVQNGARPSDFEPGNPDGRFLGVWIEPR